jgi:hypothetical protein
MKFTKGSIVWKVPDELPWEVAVAIEPLEKHLGNSIKVTMTP